MLSVASVDALHDAGLKGDRYCTGAGFWKATEACQVTLITEHDLQQAKHRAPPSLGDRLDAGHHRRNLVIAGLKMKDLDGRRFRIGTALFQHQRPRPPCGYLDRVEGDGLCHALGRTSGACIRVLESGRLAVGDALEVLED